MEKRLASLREDITRVQGENDRLSERVEALEVKQLAPASAQAAQSPSPRADRPALKVVKLVPDDAGDGSPSSVATAEPSAEERPDAPGSRPVIRVRGKELKGDDLGARGISVSEAR